MKLTDNDKRNARDLQHQPTSPVKLTRLSRLFEASVKELPLDANAPAPVTKARLAFEAAVASARQKAAKVEEAKQAQKAAAIRDVDAAAAAISAGKPTPKPSEAKAAEAVTSTLVDTEGAARLIETAHDALIESVKDEWATWRSRLISEADSARLAAVGAMEKATAAVASARSLYAGVGSLDLGVLGRYPKIAEAVHAERRGGIEWYASTCGPAPLVSVNMPNPKDKRATVTLDLSKAAEALLLAVAEPGDFTQAEWSPPDDPGHADLMAQPLDLDAPWVVAAVRRDWGSTCAICNLPPRADVVVEDERGRGLVMVHASCRGRKSDPARAERLAKMQRGGFPPSPNEASQIVPDGGRVQKDKGFGG